MLKPMEATIYGKGVHPGCQLSKTTINDPVSYLYYDPVSNKVYAVCMKRQSDTKPDGEPAYIALDYCTVDGGYRYAAFGFENVKDAENAVRAAFPDAVKVLDLELIEKMAKNVRTTWDGNDDNRSWRQRHDDILQRRAELRKYDNGVDLEEYVDNAPSMNDEEKVDEV